jgi:hypothetical protein
MEDEIRRNFLIQVVLFWVVMPCSDVGYHHFGGLHFQGEDEGSMVSYHITAQHHCENLKYFEFSLMLLVSFCKKKNP